MLVTGPDVFNSGAFSGKDNTKVCQPSSLSVSRICCQWFILFYLCTWTLVEHLVSAWALSASQWQANSKHWFTTSFLRGRCWKAMFGVWVASIVLFSASEQAHSALGQGSGQLASGFNFDEIPWRGGGKLPREEYDIKYRPLGIDLQRGYFYWSLLLHKRADFNGHRSCTKGLYLAWWEITIQYTIQYNFIAKCQYTDCTRNVLRCQVHSSHIHSNHKTFNYNNSK